MKILRIWSLSLPRQHRKSKPSFIQRILIFLGTRANLLLKVKINFPLQAITTDITKLEYRNGSKRAYLCVYKDLVGQYVYSHKVASNMEEKLVLDSFKACAQKVKKLGGGAKVIYHSDQGSQYTSYEYVEEVLKLGRISYSCKGRPTDNPGQESFFGRLKDEIRDEVLDCQTFKELQRLLDKKIDYYNNYRIHTSIGLQTPKKRLDTFLRKRIKVV